ncbi:helix-turn-helix domain-containing protein [Aquibacillus salsiterrae]|uniref:Helix-turn-helix domain-containing protein n=1 Tax=Aquibacillus salsiterrae TaxID=2950439 RepID=A0A9X3WF07_9BACI|nr:helix-turn-helix transcriptional regulator [Aquibacillus salsiterrae]MDC3418607.1 helix-turn-helix domain-containing protein [Aquibacillus salsiterrae]
MSVIKIDTNDFQHLKYCSLGKRLKFFRQKMMQFHDSGEYTITSLGERLKVTPQSISAIEREDSKNPSFLLIHKLTKEYRVPLESVTDDFYQGEERLFTIGIPVEIDAVDIDLEDLKVETAFAQNDSDHNDDFFESEVTTGILFYKAYDKDLIQPIFHKPLNDFKSYELESLIARLIFETTSYSSGTFDHIPSHPILQAREVLTQQQELLSAKNLGKLLQNLSKR